MSITTEIEQVYDDTATYFVVNHNRLYCHGTLYFVVCTQRLSTEIELGTLDTATYFVE